MSRILRSVSGIANHLCSWPSSRAGIPRAEWGNQAQWAVTALLLGAAIGGAHWTHPAALALCAVSTGYYALELRSLRSYRVQVRLGFMVVAGLALVPQLRALLWVPTVGTTAQVLIGYCPMARVLDLLPWNRTDALTVRQIVAVVTRRPGGEGLLSPRAWRAIRDARDTPTLASDRPTLGTLDPHRVESESHHGRGSNPHQPCVAGMYEPPVQGLEPRTR